MALCIECSPAVQEVPGSIPDWDASVSDALCRGCRWPWSSLYNCMIVWVRCSTVCLCDSEARWELGSSVCTSVQNGNYIHNSSPEFYSVNFSTEIIFKVIMIKAVFGYGSLWIRIRGQTLKLQKLNFYITIFRTVQKREQDFYSYVIINKKNRFFSCFLSQDRKKPCVRKMVKKRKKLQGQLWRSSFSRNQLTYPLSTYLPEYHLVRSLVGIGTPNPHLQQVSVYHPPPPLTKGGGNTLLLGGWGGGGVPIRTTWEKA